MPRRRHPVTLTSACYKSPWRPPSSSRKTSAGLRTVCLRVGASRPSANSVRLVASGSSNEKQRKNANDKQAASADASEREQTADQRGVALAERERNAAAACTSRSSRTDNRARLRNQIVHERGGAESLYLYRQEPPNSLWPRPCTNLRGEHNKHRAFGTTPIKTLREGPTKWEALRLAERVMHGQGVVVVVVSEMWSCAVSGPGGRG